MIKCDNDSKAGWISFADRSYFYRFHYMPGYEFRYRNIVVEEWVLIIPKCKIKS